MYKSLFNKYIHTFIVTHWGSLWVVGRHLGLIKGCWETFGGHGVSLGVVVPYCGSLGIVVGRRETFGGP